MFCFRAPGAEHLQVTHGDMSVPEGGAAADDLAGLPAGRGGELPEQGSLTTAGPPAQVRSRFNNQMHCFKEDNPFSVLSVLSPGKSCGSCVLSK